MNLNDVPLEKLKTDLIALAKSVAHWNAIKAEIEFPDCNSCPLCNLYFKNSCLNCPIEQETGASLCENTPYRDAADAFYGENEYESVDASIVAYAIDKEIKFLSDLCDKYETEMISREKK